MERLHQVEVLEDFVGCVVSFILKAHFCHLVHFLWEFSNHTRFEKLRLGSSIAYMTPDMLLRASFFVIALSSI